MLRDNSIRKLFDGKILTGFEITTTYQGEVIEVLGYGFNLYTMQKFLETNVLSFEDKQLKEYELICNQYKKIGIKFNQNKIQFDSKKKSSRASFASEIKNYSENYRFFLNESSLNTNSGFTRNEIYNPKSPLYVNYSSLFPNLENVIHAIHQVGGLAFLAHTFACSPNIFLNLIVIINHYPLDGLECFYTTFAEQQSNCLVQLCKERNLYMSGG